MKNVVKGIVFATLFWSFVVGVILAFVSEFQVV